MTKHDGWIAVTTAAELLGVAPRTIERYIAAGYLDAGTLPGGGVRLSRAQVVGCVKPRPRREAQ